MAGDFLPSIGPDRGGRFPIAGLLALFVPVALSVGVVKLVQARWIRPLSRDATQLLKNASAEAEKQAELAEEIDRLTRQVAALQAISRVEILWGGAAADTTRVAFPYQRSSGSSIWTHPTTNETLWYYTDEGDTLSRVAAHPRVLGAAHLWPILARENGLRITGADSLPRGQLVRVPARLNEYQIRGAVTQAGAPDKQRNEIFGQAGLKP
jgi:hypothetical protein